VILCLKRYPKNELRVILDFHSENEQPSLVLLCDLRNNAAETVKEIERIFSINKNQDMFLIVKLIKGTVVNCACDAFSKSSVI